MESTKKILGRSIQLVVFLTAAFGNFLIDIAPPAVKGFQFAVGFASFLTLGVLLYVSILSKGKTKKLYWLIAAAVLLIGSFGNGIVYQNVFLTRTIEYPEESGLRHVRGLEYTEDAAKIMKMFPNKSDQELLADFEGKIDDVWMEVSIRRAARTLTIMYALFVLTLSSCIFCLTDGLLIPAARKHKR